MVIDNTPCEECILFVICISTRPKWLSELMRECSTLKLYLDNSETFEERFEKEDAVMKFFNEAYRMCSK